MERRKGWAEAFKRCKERGGDETLFPDFFDDFITYIKDTPKAQLMEEWSKHEKWDEVGPTIKEFMNDLNK